MTYTSGMRDKRVAIYSRADATTTDFGRKGGEYEYVRTVWASVDWSRGVKSLREGALDAYDTIMVRMLYAEDITRECRLQYDNKMWIVESFHADRKENTIQITATEAQ